jgi:hypothetical protein
MQFQYSGFFHYNSWNQSVRNIFPIHQPGVSSIEKVAITDRIKEDNSIRKGKKK